MNDENCPLRLVVSLFLFWGMAISLFSQTDSVRTMKIYHRVNESVIDTSYMGNGETLKELSTFLNKGVMQDYRLDSVVISASASPEGGLAYNNRLAKERARSLYAYMLNNSILPPPQ